MQQTHKSALKNFLYCSLPLHITFGWVKKTFILGVLLFTFIPLQDLLVTTEIAQSNKRIKELGEYSGSFKDVSSNTVICL